MTPTIRWEIDEQIDDHGSYEIHTCLLVGLRCGCGCRWVGDAVIGEVQSTRYPGKWFLKLPGAEGMLHDGTVDEARRRLVHVALGAEPTAAPAPARAA